MNFNLAEEEIIKDFCRVGFQRQGGFTVPPYSISDVFLSLRGVRAKISGSEFQFDKDGKVVFKSVFTSREECYLAYCLISWSVCFTEFLGNTFYVTNSVKNSDQYIQAIRKTFPKFAIDFDARPFPSFVFIKDPLLEMIAKLESKDAELKEFGLTKTWQLIEHENKKEKEGKKSKKDEIRDILIAKEKSDVWSLYSGIWDKVKQLTSNYRHSKETIEKKSLCGDIELVCNYVVSSLKLLVWLRNKNNLIP